MSFQDHIVQNPNRYKITNNPDGTVTLTPTWIENPNEVIQQGTPLNAEIFTEMDQKIETTNQQLADMGVQKADKTYVDIKAQGVSLAFKESYATLADLQAAYPTGDIHNHPVKTDDMIYTWANGAWTNTQIQANGTGVPDGSLGPEKTTYLTANNQNLFNPDKVVSGKRLSASGTFVDDPLWDTSELLPIVSGHTFLVFADNTITGRICAYNADGTFLKVITSGYNTTGGYSIPADWTGWIRIPVLKTAVPKTQFVDAAIYNGSFTPFSYLTSEKIKMSPQSFQPKSLTAGLLADDVKELIKSLALLATNLLKTPEQIAREYLFNPLVPAKFKLLGDSRTHGSGGTGYAQDGDVIPGTDPPVQMNPNGYCWANSLRDLLQAKYGGWRTFNFDSQYIKKETTNYIDNTASGNYQFRNNVAGQNLTSFSFHGEEVKVLYTTYVNGGIVEVYIDGTLHSTIDTYSATQVKGIEHSITVPKGEHTLLIKGTNTKNASAGGVIFTFQGIKFYKKVQVVNYGQAGKNSQQLYNQRDTLIEADDDVVIMMPGTNDRHNLSNTGEMKRYLRGIIETAYAKGAEFILMSPPPVTSTETTGDNDPIRNFGMFDIDKALQELAAEYGMEHISNYDATLQYAEYRGISPDALLADGLHENDEGHDVEFRNILREMGITYRRPGVTK